MKTVVNAMHILDVLFAGHEHQKVNDIAQACGLNRITTYKILGDLAEAGLVCKTHRNSRYGLGPKLLAAPMEVVSRTDLRRIARPYLEKLAEACGQSINLLILVGDRGYYADILNPEATNHIDQIGQMENLFLTSLGRAILAYLPQDRVRRLAEGAKEVEDMEGFFEELALTRKRGFALQDGLVREDSRGVAAPVFSSYGDVIASVCISGLADKVTISRLLEYSDQVRETAGAITAALASMEKA